MTMKDEELSRLFAIPPKKREKTDESKHARFKFLPVDHPANWTEIDHNYKPRSPGYHMQQRMRRLIQQVPGVDPDLEEEALRLSNQTTEDITVEKLVDRARTLREISSRPFKTD